MNEALLSSEYDVKKLTEADIKAVYELCSENLLFYKHCPPLVTEKSILKDMNVLPPRTVYDDKYYLGFYSDIKLVSVMDLILNFPNPETAFVGFFMVAKSEQGKGVGSRIVGECFDALKNLGYRYIRLGFAKGNPQSESFWRKNGFLPTGAEYDGGGYTVVVMQKTI